jgi:hemoglobin
MKKLYLTFAISLLAVFTASTASAQTASTASMAASTDMMKDSSLYTALGEKTGITQIANDFVGRLIADERTRPFFEKANQPRLKMMLADQFCAVSGGPCVYKGADMKSAHSNLDINKANFNALVEVLQQTMDAHGIAFKDQNRLLALLAPMHRDVITVK